METRRTEIPVYALVDWGTSSFRLWLVCVGGHVLAQSRSDEGMMYATGAGFSETLEKHLNALQAPENLPVVISGMAGARQGWVEAPYVPLPAACDALAKHAIKVPHHTRDIRILPGLSQDNAEMPNVMRGEETQLSGIIGAMPNGLICMPGTHCKWVELKNAQVTSMTTFMTGEFFAVLSHHSILQHAINPDVSFDGKTPAFMQAACRAMAAPAQALAMIFSIRAGQLLGFEGRANGAAYLSGLLIGAEVAAAREIYSVTSAGLVASERLNNLYQPVMQEAGFSVALFDGEEAVRSGLLDAATQIKSSLGV